MTQLIDYMMEPETALVFDIDGVLAPYEFGELRHSACPDEGWEEYVRTQDPYAHIRPVKLIQEMIEQKGPERVFACSVAASYELAGKRDFCLQEYGLAPENVSIVAAKVEKIEFLHQVSQRLGLPTERVVLIEDTVKTLDMAMDAGFATAHVSSLFAFGE